MEFNLYVVGICQLFYECKAVERMQTEGKIITSTFATQTFGRKDQEYTESRVKNILYIKGTDGKEYLWYDPKLINQKANSYMMRAYKVLSIGDLEGKHIKFKPTGTILKIEDKEYELVTVTPPPLGD